MKTLISLYPEFQHTIQTCELVYLFGTGISAALTGRSYSWWQWIMGGIAQMKDTVLASACQTSLTNDSTTENMIEIAGQVLSATKADGTYADWMHTSFETNPLTNTALAATLKKLLLTQDVFATTNYDLLLEQATGLPTLSYEEPDQAFRMLDQKKSTHVLHIHGVYDSARGVDNIVADRLQYAAVLNDKGAQFIQHILGTRTLIFIGCGQTTEDANIAQFIQFARTCLHMDQDYYFLYKKGQEPMDMPDNIRLIPYGDEYQDLPEFLEEMARERLNAKIESHPLILRTIHSENPMDAYGLSEFHYAREYLKFCGRKTELARLSNFTATDKPFQWWALTGQGGAGKSRLAYEFLHRVQKHYFGFFLNVHVSDEIVDSFAPFNDTLAVVDYIKGNEKQTAGVLSRLYDTFSRQPYKLRVLLLERDNFLLTGSWYSELMSALDPFHRGVYNNSEYNVDLATGNHRFLYLDDLEEPAVVELIGDVCAKSGLPADPSRDRRLKADYAQKFEQLKFRPLFLQMYVQAWIANGCTAVDYVNYKSLLEIILKREQERILQMFQGNIPVLNELMKLVVRAGVSGGARLADLESLYPVSWNAVKSFVKTHSIAGAQRAEYQQSILKDISQDIVDEQAVLNPLYPDIIKEYMLLYYLDEEDLQAVSTELWHTCPAETNVFLSRCLMDFQGDKRLTAFVRGASADYTNRNAMEVRLALLAYKIVHTIEDGVVFMRLAKEEYAYWQGVPRASENLPLILRGLCAGVWQFFGWSMESECFAAIDEIASLEVPKELQAAKARALLEFVHYLTEKNCVPAAKHIFAKAQAAVDAVSDSFEKTELWLSLQREFLVLQIYRQEWNAVSSLHETLHKTINWKDETQTELYAYFCFTGARQCFRRMKWEKLLYFADLLQELAVEYADGERDIAFHDKVHYYYLHTKLMQIEAGSITSHLAGLGAMGLRMTDALIEEIEHNEMIADFAGLLVGAKALKVGTDDAVTDEEAGRYLAEADRLLEQYPDNAVLAEKAMDLWETVYEVQFKRTVSREIVERAYALALRFSKDAEVLDQFFRLLDASEERKNWLTYTKNKAIVTGLMENELGEYLLPPMPGKTTGLAYAMRQPVARRHPKIGRNDPCPCGSGKKFKRCCIGTGKYD